MLGERLAAVRESADESLREFAARLDEVGYSVSHNAVRKYEQRDSVPSAYLLAVVEACDVDPLWLLSGRDDLHVSARSRDVEDQLLEFRRDYGDACVDADLSRDVRRAWEEFRDGLDPSHPLRDTILASWKRCRATGLQPAHDSPDVPTVTDGRLEQRREQLQHFLAATAPHLRWLSERVRPVDHVAYVVSREGIVLDALGAGEQTAAEWRLTPGHVWSEEAMGTNGAGTALTEGRPTVVIGPEHYLEAFQGFVCTGCPIRGPSREIVGALDLTTPLRDGRPERLALASYAALAAERDFLRRTTESTRSERPPR